MKAMKACVSTQSDKQMNAKQRRRLKQRQNRKTAQTLDKEMSAKWFFDLNKAKLPFGIDLGGLRAGSGTVGVAPKALDIQRSMPRLRSAKSMDGNIVDVITGTDLIATVSSAALGNEAGDLLITQLISPTQFESSRLRQFASLYQRYRFKKIRFVYEPIANATQSGQLVGYADFDPDNEILSNSAVNVSFAVAHQGQQITQIWEPAVFDMSQVGTFTDLYSEPGGSSSDPRLSIQGIFYLIAASVLPANIALGNVYIDYEVEFSIPFLEQASGTLAFSTSYLTDVHFEVSGASPTTLVPDDSSTTLLISEGPYVPQLIGGDIVFDENYMGVPLVPGQKIYISVIFREFPFVTPGATGHNNLDFSGVSVPALATTVADYLKPETGVTTGVTADWGSAGSCVCTVTDLTEALIVSMNMGGAIITGPGRMLIAVQVTKPPLSMNGFLRAKQLQFKRSRPFREEVRRWAQLHEFGGRKLSKSVIRTPEKGSDEPVPSPPQEKGKSPVRTPPPMEEIAVLRTRLLELEDRDD